MRGLAAGRRASSLLRSSSGMLPTLLVPARGLSTSSATASSSSVSSTAAALNARGGSPADAPLAPITARGGSHIG